MVTLQACAAAMLEEYLDEWQTALEADMKKEGYYIRPRFSPGYGDFDMAHQDMILLRMLDTAKKIGLTHRRQYADTVKIGDGSDRSQ